MGILLGLLTTVDENLGAVFTRPGNIETLREKFNVPEKFLPVGAILIGYPAESDRESISLKRGKKPLQDTVCYNSWH